MARADFQHPPNCCPDCGANHGLDCGPNWGPDCSTDWGPNRSDKPRRDRRAQAIASGRGLT